MRVWCTLLPLRFTSPFSFPPPVHSHLETFLFLPFPTLFHLHWPLPTLTACELSLSDVFSNTSGSKVASGIWCILPCDYLLQWNSVWQPNPSWAALEAAASAGSLGEGQIAKEYPTIHHLHSHIIICADALQEKARRGEPCTQNPPFIGRVWRGGKLLVSWNIWGGHRCSTLLTSSLSSFPGLSISGRRCGAQGWKEEMRAYKGSV